MFKSIVLSISLLQSCFVYAQSSPVISVSSSVIKPQQMMKHGKLVGCGLDVHMPVSSSPSEIRFVTVSFWSVNMESGLVGYRSESVPLGQPPKWVSNGVVESAWVRIANGDAIKQGVLQKEVDGRASALADVVPVTMAMVELNEKTPTLQVGLRMRGAGSEVVYSGTATVSSSDQNIIRACIGELMQRGIAESSPNR
jgi:hypothetical protein